MSAPSNKVLIFAIPVLWAAALASAAGAIYSKHRARQLFVELEQLNARRDNLEIEWGQLQLVHARVRRERGRHQAQDGHAATERHRAGEPVKAHP
jgi:cell division protein FtsL